MGLLEDDLEPTDEERPIVRIYRHLPRSTTTTLRPRRRRTSVVSPCGGGQEHPLYLAVFFFFFPRQTEPNNHQHDRIVLRMKFNDSATLRRTLTYRTNEPTDASRCGDADATHASVEELRSPLLLPTIATADAEGNAT